MQIAVCNNPYLTESNRAHTAEYPQGGERLQLLQAGEQWQGRTCRRGEEGWRAPCRSAEQREEAHV